MARLLEQYRSEAVPALRRRFGYANPMEVPRLEKIVVNMGVGEGARDFKLIEAAQQELLRQSLDELRQQTKTDAGTIRAFEMLALDGRRPADVAAEMSITLNDVYLAKHRCLKRLRAILTRLEQVYEIN